MLHCVLIIEQSGYVNMYEVQCLELTTFNDPNACGNSHSWAVNSRPNLFYYSIPERRQHHCKNKISSYV